MNAIRCPRMPITGPLRSQINRLAHTLAQQHEMRLKADLMRRVETARSEGASYSELVALLERVEQESQT